MWPVCKSFIFISFRKFIRAVCYCWDANTESEMVLIFRIFLTRPFTMLKHRDQDDNSKIIIEFCSFHYSQPTYCTLWMLQPGWYCQILIFEMMSSLFNAVAIAKIMKHDETEVNFCQNLDFFSIFSYLWSTWRSPYLKILFWNVCHTKG